MRKRIAILSLLVMTLAAAALLTYFHTWYDRTPGFRALRLKTRQPERLLVKTEGMPGQEFSAIFTVDGKRREVSGVTPAQFALECVVLIGEVPTFDGDGSFNLLIERQDGIGRFYTPPALKLSRFRYHRGVIALQVRN